MYKLELYEKELKATANGREILNLVIQHAEEVTRLVNQNREVMVTWKRNHGPEFFSQLMASGFNVQATVPKELHGITLLSLVRRMAVVLQDYGSPELVATIDEYLLPVLDYTAGCDSLHQLFQKLRLHQ
jgi:Zn-dependent M16 (insulinase) family peptidase